MPDRTVPTVDVYLEVRSGQADWCWAAFPGGAAAEFAYTRPELLKLLGTYGHWGSIMTGGRHVRVTVRGRFSGRYLAQQEWAGNYALTEPWVHVPAWHNLTLSAQLHIPRYSDHDERRLIDTGQTDVSTLRLKPVVDYAPSIPQQTPHVRHREDVPHEHALPDLYGLTDWTDGRFSA